MEQTPGEIRLAYTDPQLNETLKALDAHPSPFSRHFSQNEEFFLRLPVAFSVPSLPIHHDVRLRQPGEAYRNRLIPFLLELASVLPAVFKELTYVFDPAETLRPFFFQVYRYGEETYLYCLRLDLMYKPAAHEIVRRGTNDETAEYRGRDLYLDVDMIPLESVMSENGTIVGFSIRRMISQTWVGETGRGYFVQGIWLDRDLTKFFSRLFLPAGRRFYPYFPFNCKHRSICMSLVNVDPLARRERLPLLQRAIQFLVPVMGEIESALKIESFSDGMQAFQALKAFVPAFWDSAWGDLRLKPYINQNDMKEYLIEG